MAFNEKDAANVERIKDLMVEKAMAGDPAAATAFASLLNAETARNQASLAAPDQSQPAPGAPASSWREAVAGSDRVAENSMAA